MPKLGSLPLEDLDEDQIESFISELRQEKELSRRYQRNVCALIVRVMKYMKRRHHFKAEIPENPLSPEKKGEKEIPGEKNFAVLEQYLMEQAMQGEETCLGILTAFYTGIRIGEVCALTWNDIDLEESVIYIRRNLQRVKTIDGQKNPPKSDEIFSSCLKSYPQGRGHPALFCDKNTVPHPDCG